VELAGDSTLEAQTTTGPDGEEEDSQFWHGLSCMTESAQVSVEPIAEESPRAGSESGGVRVERGGSTRQRAIQGWLNHVLTQVAAEQARTDKSAEAWGSMRASGMEAFGINQQNLENLGLDAVARDRVMQMLCVYSQGLQTAFESVVKRSDNPNQVQEVIWRAWSALMEYVSRKFRGVTTRPGVEFVASEEPASVSPRRRADEEVARLKQELEQRHRERLRMEEDLNQQCTDLASVRSELGLLEAKYTAESRLRVKCELELADKVRWLASLEADLTRERRLNLEASQVVETVTRERDEFEKEAADLRLDLGEKETRLSTYRHTSLDWAQQKAKYDLHVDTLEKSVESLQQRVDLMQNELTARSEQIKNFDTERMRITREFEMQAEQLFEKEREKLDVSKERDMLEVRVEVAEREKNEAVEALRELSNKYDELEASHTADDIELQRLRKVHQEFMDQFNKLKKEHWEMSKTSAALRTFLSKAQAVADIAQKEAAQHEQELKELRATNALLQTQLQLSQDEAAEQSQALTDARKALADSEQKRVRATAATSRATVAARCTESELQEQRKCSENSYRVLQRVILDERTSRATLVAETKQATNELAEKAKELEISRAETREVRRQQNELADECERLTKRLKAREHQYATLQAQAAQLRASVSNQEAELVQLQRVLEADRLQHQTTVEQMREAYADAVSTSEKTIDGWRMVAEDFFSRIAFSPATEKVAELVAQVTELQNELDSMDEELHQKDETVQRMEALKQKAEYDLSVRVADQDRLVAQFNDQVYKTEGMRLLLDRANTQYEDALHRLQQSGEQSRAIREQHAKCAGREAKLHEKIILLESETNKPVTNVGVQVHVTHASIEAQTDLSYGFLEAHPPSTSVSRSSKIHIIKKSSRFVEDLKDERDFHLNFQSHSRKEVVPPAEVLPVVPVFPRDSGPPSTVGVAVGGGLGLRPSPRRSIRNRNRNVLR